MAEPLDLDAEYDAVNRSVYSHDDVEALALALIAELKATRAALEDTDGAVQLRSHKRGQAAR